MRIRGRLVGLLLVVGGLVAAASAPCVLACSCMPPQPLAQSIDADTVVVVGQVGASIGGDYPFVVERWFAGPQPTAVLTVNDGREVMPDGTVSHNSCGRSFSPGERLVLVGSQAGTRLATNSCSLGAPVDSPDGQQLIADAEALFGPGVAPDQPDDPIGDPAGGDGGAIPWPALLLGAAGLGLTALAAGAVVLLLRRRPSAP